MVDWVSGEDEHPIEDPPMIIEVGCSWSKLQRATVDQREWLEQYLGCERGSYYIGKELFSDWFTLVSDTGIIPSGVIGLAEKAAKKEGIALEVRDYREQRAPISEHDNTADLSWLRPYQLKATKALIEAKRGILEAQTGSGKTEVIIAVTLALRCEWLYVVHRTDLVEQTARRILDRTGDTAGTFTTSTWTKGTGNVTVATFQSIKSAARKRRAAYLQFRDSIQGVFVDEVHAQPARTFYGVTMSLKNAYYRFGCSATPLEKTDVATLKTIGSLGPVVHRVPLEMLVEKGFLAMPEVTMVRFCHGMIYTNHWNTGYTNHVVENVERNDLIGDIVSIADKPCFLFVEYITHAYYLLNLLPLYGISVDVAHGKHWKKQRRQKLDALAKGDLEVLICTVIFQEGIDLPELRSVVVAGGKKSSVASLQRIGRGMRRQPDKKVFQVWDVYDEASKWFGDHSERRIEAYESRGYNVKVLDSLP